MPEHFKHDGGPPPIPRYLPPYTIQTLCLAFFVNDPHQAVGHRPGQVLVGNLALISAIRIRSRSTAKKQRFVDAVKMLIDIAKESSDAFPPLKSCLGGINALIKHYDVGRRRLSVNIADGRQPGIQ